MILAQDVALGVNPLTELPIVGPVVALIDKALRDADIPPVLVEAVELFLIGIGLFIVLRILTRNVLPWLFAALVGPIVALLDAMRMVLLLPQLAVTALYDRRGSTPTQAVYAYGDGVMHVSDVLQTVARQGLPAFGAVRKLPGLVLIALLVLLFLQWNNDYCGPDSPPGCVSPVAHWTGQL